MNNTIKEQWESGEMTIEAYSILNHIDKVCDFLKSQIRN